MSAGGAERKKTRTHQPKLSVGSRRLSARTGDEFSPLDDVKLSDTVQADPESGPPAAEGGRTRKNRSPHHGLYRRVMSCDVEQEKPSEFPGRGPRALERRGEARGKADGKGGGGRKSP